MADYLKLPELARRLGVSEKTARRMVKAGKLPAIFVGNAYRVREADLEAYLEGAKVEPGGGPTLFEAEPPPPLRLEVVWDASEEERRRAWEAASVEERAAYMGDIERTLERAKLSRDEAASEEAENQRPQFERALQRTHENFVAFVFKLGELHNEAEAFARQTIHAGAA